MAKVSIVRCEDYERENVYNAVKRSVDLLGGIGSFVKTGMSVLIKPNLLSARIPEDAVDTHPEVVRAVVRLVKGAGGVPMIGDSPGGYGENVNEIFQKSGMRSIADEEGVELIKFSSSRFVEGIPVARHVFDCDYMISVPKLKTHSITVITAAIKNVFGTVPGLFKAECHSMAPRENEFAKTIAKVYSISKPDISIVDAIVAMEGDGPSSGEPRSMNFVMAGEDAVAIDSCIAKIIGLRPEEIFVTKEACQMGLGETNFHNIEICGDGLKDFIAKDFKLPQTTALKIVPPLLLNGVAALVRFKPFIDESVCARCNLCKVMCPVDAITIDKESCRVDYDKCVRCLCCHEVCPYKAMRIKRNILTKMIWG
jgi:uncharacterized protein (DUF362 family)/Pyruvate/2-oxoacid:ferredoxin oxidoreductase delta subunit